MSASATCGSLAKVFSGPCLGCGATVNVYAEPDEKIDVSESLLCDECMGKLLRKLTEEGTIP
ncbi:MAG: hypothetical protein ABSD56_00145 [Bryobacteraceae bacterium]|jgi:DNA-directed RNA polymerase subunit RPC12/RpoP